MRFLDALVPARANSTLITWDQYVSDVQAMLFQGNAYPLGLQTTYGREPAEQVSANFAGYVQAGLFGNGVVFGLERKRVEIFSQARFQFQRMRDGRPGDLYGTAALSVLERPWPGATTGDLLARKLLYADFAGNSFAVRINQQIILLRPDWVQIVLAPRVLPYGADNGEDVPVGFDQVGIMYYEGGIMAGAKPAVFLTGEYCHFAPIPDPLATYRGMSWLTPVIRELQADTQATKHKQKFFENAATPNLAVSLPKELTPQQFREFIDLMESKHRGVEQAYKTLYTGGGADVTVIGADMKQLDFKATQGAGETRLALAAGIHPTVAGLSEGMQGSSLNAGNYSSAKRQVVDTTIRYLWQNMAGSLESIVPAPADSRLWYDARDIPFLHDEMKDRAEIQATQAQAFRQLVDAGYTPESVKNAMLAEDWSLLQHSGLFSVQLQPPGADQPSNGGTGADAA